MEEKEKAWKQNIPRKSRSCTPSPEQYSRSGWVCLLLFLVVAVLNASGTLTGASVDVVQTGLLVGFIVCFVVAWRAEAAASCAQGQEGTGRG